MANNNRISINAFEEAACISDDSRAIKWNGLIISVRQRIKYEEMVSLISGVAEASFDKDGSYHPEATEFALRLGVIALYTNLTVPANIEKRYEMAFGTDVYEKIEEAISPTQIGMIRTAIERTISVRVNAAVEAVIRQANAVNKAVSELKDRFESEFSSLLEGVTPEDINRVIRRLADGEIDEGKIVGAYLDNTRTIREDTMDDGK